MAAQTAWARRLSRRSTLIAGGAAAAFLAACSGSDTKDAAKATTAAGGSPAAGAALPEPKRGGTYSEQITGDPPGFDPVLNFDFRQLFLNYKTYNGLLRFKLSQIGPDDAVIENDLAEKYEQVDPVTHRFTLREGVTFHSGDPLTAEDVTFSLNRLKTTVAPTFEKDFLYKPIDKVTAPDSRTIVVTTDGPYAVFPYSMAWRPENSIVQKATVEKEGDLSKVINGTGAFKLSGFERGSVYRFERHPTFFKKGLPHFDKVNYQVILDPTAQLTAFRSGQSDMAFDFALTPSTLEPTKRAVPDLQVVKSYSSGHSALDLKSDAPPFSDQRVRNGLALSIDRQKLIDTLYQGEGYPTYYIPAHFKEYANPNPEKLPNMRPDLTKAKQLFAAAGFTGGKIEYKIPNTSPVLADSASLLKEMLAPTGVVLDIKIVDNAEWLAAGRNGELLIAAFGRIAGLDPDEYTYARYNEKGKRRFHRGLDPQLSDLTLKQRQAADKEERKKLLRQIEERAADLTFDVKTAEAYFFFGYRGYLKNYFPHMSNLQRVAEEAWKDA